jgi:hypothetical protein
VFGKPSGLMLRVNQLVVDLHVEDAAPPLDQLGINPELLFELFRQTGGFGEVVSLYAILNRDMHDRILLRSTASGRS